MFSSLALSALIAAALPAVNAHGTVSGVVSAGKYYAGFNPSDVYISPPPARVGWSTDDLSNGFIAPDAYANPNIICHTSATPAQASVPVAAGSTVDLQWTPWPVSHHGPILNYLAPCANGDCTKVDKTTLSFFKIGSTGLIDDNVVPGNWATDKLIANNNTWTLKIPSNLKPGPYVLRHEIIALHSAGTADGAQNYMQCINLQVTGSGSATATGAAGTALYKETDPGIIFNIYTAITSYPMPGPAVPAVFASTSAKFRRSFFS